MTEKLNAVAVDAMGGDFGPSVVVPGALKAARETGAKIVFVGISDEIEAVLQNCDTSNVVYEIVHASQVAEMHESPSDVLRRKKDSSIQVACRLLQDKKVDGVFSAGHSGATVACGMFILGRIPGIERPALATLLPTEKEPMMLLDVGANVECKPIHLLQFALMGSTFLQGAVGRENPKVGILSIGEEEGKGNTLVKESFELLKIAKDVNFLGNIEGRDIFSGEVDVAVCDGFVGNIALKLSEGLALSLTRILKRELLSNGILSKLGVFLAKTAFVKFKKRIDYSEYGGAPVLGLRGVCIVGHGSSNEKAICSGIKIAIASIENGTNDRLIDALQANDELSRYLSTM